MRDGRRLALECERLLINQYYFKTIACMLDFKLAPCGAKWLDIASDKICIAVGVFDLDIYLID